ncbi:hypothetical protein Psta_2656 [Pirellula staleyi DSM 6068]|uniref:Uncharacterized protein n=1 Tax=Pirellula staleyi (strain ATCC 27377 / DSM 6068 / ICPB 4128) TaxID=530564 RepID=D2R6M5_PIRSD|nr:hypothetical protein Psta_2656 [Pirellula staleyi DSM 6068]
MRNVLPGLRPAARDTVATGTFDYQGAMVVHLAR